MILKDTVIMIIINITFNQIQILILLPIVKPIMLYDTCYLFLRYPHKKSKSHIDN